MRSSLTDHRPVIIDEDTEFGARVAAHLRDDVVIWLTTVADSGAPLPTCVWFVWDGDESVRVQSLPTARRVEHLGAGHDRVALNFPGNGQGGDIVVLTGRGRIADDAPPIDGVDAYMSKYHEHIERLGLTPQQFAGKYSTAVDIRLTRLRGH
jgi:PPOX class probable F420-dependent enzyme